MGIFVLFDRPSTSAWGRHTLQHPQSLGRQLRGEGLSTSNLSWEIPLKCDEPVHGCERKSCGSTLSLCFHYWTVCNQSSCNFQILALHVKSPTNLDINLGWLKMSYCVVSQAGSSVSWFLSVCIQPSLIIFVSANDADIFNMLLPYLRRNSRWSDIFYTIVRQHKKDFLRRDVILRHYCLHLRVQIVN